MIRVVFEAKSPVAVSEWHRVQGDVAGALDYIPGSALRGALAAAYLAETGDDEKSDFFKQVFLSGESRFGNLYPNGGFPIPLTALTCRLTPGFITDGGHGVFDSLLKLLLGNGEAHCIQHGETAEVDLGRFTGFYVKRNGSFRKASAPKRIIARTALDQSHGTSKHGMLYAMEAVEEGTVFIGYVKIKRENWEKLVGTFPCAIENGRTDDLKRVLSIGSARTRGLGEISLIEWREIKDVSIYGRDPENLEVRFDKFNEMLRKSLPTENDTFYFTIGLDSDLLLLDDHMRSMTYLAPEVLASGLRDSNESKAILNAICVASVSSYRTVIGWNQKIGLPKANQVAISKGSVFLYKACGVKKENLLPALRALELEGVGERKNEGFGGIVVCDPFHVEGDWR